MFRNSIEMLKGRSTAFGGNVHGRIDNGEIFQFIGSSQKESLESL